MMCILMSCFTLLTSLGPGETAKPCQFRQEENLVEFGSLPSLQLKRLKIEAITVSRRRTRPTNNRHSISHLHVITKRGAGGGAKNEKSRPS